MDVTILGSGEMTGVPPMFADLETANADARRRRPGLLVETEDTTVLFDISPDVREQVNETGIDNLDAAFVTHFHHDHAGGIDDLALVAPYLDIDVYMSDVAVGHFRNQREYLSETIDPQTFDHGDQIAVGEVTIIPFPVAHGRPDFDTVGFAVYHDGSKVVYAPDIEQFCPNRTAGEEYLNADLLFVEGSPVFRDDLFEDVEFTEMLFEANAARTVLIHVNEFLDGSTKQMTTTATDHGFELGRDFASYQV